MPRLLAALLLLLVVVGCDDEDPATSEHCVMVRMRVIDLQFWRSKAHPASVASFDVSIARLQSENWQCFR